jgi:hypothetical protein
MLFGAWGWRRQVCLNATKVLIDAFGENMKKYCIFLLSQWYLLKINFEHIVFVKFNGI